ncbi:MAG: glycosyltransferase family 2 protein [Patescibacteria group bacterium]|jgi:glycosyltransferase involved in cell wall biosynthesis
MKFSIITPSYNQAQFIERTIKSVLSQTGDFELEYIIMDGGSTDGSVETIKHYAQQDKRIIWRSEKDSGQSNAINKGLKLASGDIIAYLNSDDIYLPNALQMVMEEFKKNTTISWVTGQCKIINKHDVEIKKIITCYKNFFLKHYSHSSLLVLNYISQPATFWRKTVLLATGEFNEKEHLVMDYEYWLRLSKKYQLNVIDKYLAGFRSYQSNKSSLRFVEQFKSEHRIAAQYTNNPLIIFLHKLHSWLIISCYKLLS